MRMDQGPCGYAKRNGQWPVFLDRLAIREIFEAPIDTYIYISVIDEAICQGENPDRGVMRLRYAAP
ncbi:MAG: hypothetical protein D6690_16605 [Nitrospirae bacterium]|nr:MAG: hypothetical protein D6690_16605 [Nitrospirota bacterium]